MESPRHSCLKLELPNPTEPDKIEPIFIKATWYDIHFDFSITNGIDLWVCKGFQQPGSVYKFTDVGNGQRREEVVRKTKSFERLKVEIEKCLAQSESFINEKTEF
ncbi:hypothetical protein CRG98_043095 [Punica granatum]|uniref:Uncharacterized protein n=1 Tax=Punica granatum TaxID=22663 RepID=A0A2I0HXT2_PUNGR|nr:hypothetical protein CRG98_043095 [Punica granatum]